LHITKFAEKRRNAKAVAEVREVHTEQEKVTEVAATM